MLLFLVSTLFDSILPQEIFTPKICDLIKMLIRGAVFILSISHHFPAFVVTKKKILFFFKKIKKKSSKNRITNMLHFCIIF
jgi:hypothetical protein